MKQTPNFRSGSLFGTSSPSLLTSVANSPASTVRRPLLVWLAAAGLLVSSQAVAQEYALLTSKPKPVAAPVESAKAFWKMTNIPGTDSTLVGFYTPNNALMYEEKVPSKAAKLTKRTLRTLNETTDRLVGMNGKAADRHTLSDALAGEKIAREGQLQMGSYASRDGIHLHLMLDNPAHDYVMIELLNKEGQSMYQTATRMDRPHYKFNLQGLPTGDYKLRIMGKKQTFERNLTFGAPNPEPVIPTLRMAVN